MGFLNNSHSEIFKNANFIRLFGLLQRPYPTELSTTVLAQDEARASHISPSGSPDIAESRNPF